MRRDHPRIRDRLTAKQFNAAQHIDVQLALGRGGTCHEIADQKWLALAAMLPLRITRPAFEMPTATVTLTWHARTDADAGARYFRDLIARAVRN
ncbi:MAG TPA: hypothetical protein VFQ65_15280 [Kofleriaceae bacterium]|nr:hypothetical protein [Kofleriaceae bacterium]